MKIVTRLLEFFGGEPVPYPTQPDGQSCENCAYFSGILDPDDPPDGYCGVNFALDRNAQYGNWMNHDGWCRHWRATNESHGSTQPAPEARTP